MIYFLYAKYKLPDVSYLFNFDDLGLFLGLIASGLGTIVSLYSIGSIKPENQIKYYYPLFLIAIAGTIAIGFANDLFTIFVMVEFSALPSYFLVAYNYQKEKIASSAAIKYLIQGVTGTLTALLGISFIFLITGTLDVDNLMNSTFNFNQSIVLIAIVLIIVGYGVKLAFVPLHTWLPDTYCYSIPSVTFILASITKIGFFVGLIKTLFSLPTGFLISVHVGIIIGTISIFTMTVGNFLALIQKNLKRMLAYSSITQMGYIIVGLAIALEYNFIFGMIATLFYLVAYSIMKGGAFLCAGMFESLGIKDISSLKGIGKNNPLLSICFVIFILSLIGMPVTVGFLGKLFLIESGIKPFHDMSLILTFVLIINTAISLGYYVPAITSVFSKNNKKYKVTVNDINWTQYAAIVILAIITIVLGFYSPIVFNVAKAAAGILMGGR
jgi:proton-translocating NADH-quinone oxidoreductase chain N